MLLNQKLWKNCSKPFDKKVVPKLSPGFRRRLKAYFRRLLNCGQCCKGHLPRIQLKMLLNQTIQEVTKYQIYFCQLNNRWQSIDVSFLMNRLFKPELSLYVSDYFCVKYIHSEFSFYYFHFLLWSIICIWPFVELRTKYFVLSLVKLYFPSDQTSFQFKYC